MKILFALPFLPHDNISVESFINGHQSLSGSQSSTLLIADALAKRDHTVGLWVMAGHTTKDSSFINYTSLKEVINEHWDRIILASWGDSNTFIALQNENIRPLLWTHIHVSKETLLDLENNNLSGIITVSDTARLSLLHSSKAHQIGSIYNPLNPFFAIDTEVNASRYASKTIVFCGHLGHSKGAHLILEMWPKLKKLIGDVKLVMIGSGKLYKSGASIGQLGLAAPEFELKYLDPIVRQFGSLEQADIEFTGLMAPQQMKEIYNKSALGFINFNWHSFTETFCCVGAEMLATALPIFSFAAGSLPETMGKTGGAVLCKHPNLEMGAKIVADLLNHPDKLKELGTKGKSFVLEHYSLQNITNRWEILLKDNENNFNKLSGQWRGTRNSRYWIEITINRLRAQKIYRLLRAC